MHIVIPLLSALSPPHTVPLLTLCASTCCVQVAKNQSWILWSEYQKIAEDCHVNNATSLKITTHLLHDLGTLRYFGDMDQVSTNARAVKSRADEILHDSVFVNIAWAMGVVRSVISHDRCGALYVSPLGFLC